ncbi:MAG TPA: molecular chaperone DnaK, partial [Acidimicrobiales bacterium]|nr:molecular chaperone DnaK [Acidimicrobiales bacterium]
QGVKDALSGTDIEGIKTATEKLMTASQGFSQRLYEQAAQSAQSSASADGPAGGGYSDEPSDDEVVDAEIVDEQ